MSRILFAPSSPLSLHDTPRAGEVVTPLVQPLGGSWARAFRIRLGQEPAPVEVEDEREQQAIADAVEGVIP